MSCPKCGATNRDGASFCDSCGEPLVPDVQRPAERSEVDGLDDEAPQDERLLDKGGLTGLMATDWTLHFVAAAVVGFLLGLVMIGMGYHAYSVFFFVIGLVGILGTRYMLRAKA